ncbi:MAG: hypothetical protein MZV70_66650 [Desulfobacterales bacterium]|nr:hypothetical protein [Desulfobacterales bacterium]
MTGTSGPGEIVFITADGCESRKPPEERLQICSFLWVYYGYPASTYEGINVEDGAQPLRRRPGPPLPGRRRLRRRHPRLGHRPRPGLRHRGPRCPSSAPSSSTRPPGPRSFMPQHQEVRDLVARMKLIPIRELIAGRRILFCEDSIVRGTQLERHHPAGSTTPAPPRSTCGRPARRCSTAASSSISRARARRWTWPRARPSRDLARARTAGRFADYARAGTAAYDAMEEWIRRHLNLTTLKLPGAGRPGRGHRPAQGQALHLSAGTASARIEPLGAEDGRRPGPRLLEGKLRSDGSGGWI